MSIGHKLCKSNRCPGSGGWKLGHYIVVSHVPRASRAILGPDVGAFDLSLLLWAYVTSVAFWHWHFLPEAP